MAVTLATVQTHSKDRTALFQQDRTLRLGGKQFALTTLPCLFSIDERLALGAQWFCRVGMYAFGAGPFMRMVLCAYQTAVRLAETDRYSEAAMERAASMPLLQAC